MPPELPSGALPRATAAALSLTFSRPPVRLSLACPPCLPSHQARRRETTSVHLELRETGRQTLADSATGDGRSPVEAIRHLLHNLYIYHAGYSALDIQISMSSQRLTA